MSKNAFACPDCGAMPTAEDCDLLAKWQGEFHHFGFYCRPCATKHAERPTYIQGAPLASADPLAMLDGLEERARNQYASLRSKSLNGHSIRWSEVVVDDYLPVAVTQVMFTGYCRGCMGLISIFEGGWVESDLFYLTCDEIGARRCELWAMGCDHD